MRVILAGYNVESEMIKKAGDEFGVELTPEVISAAYARISRDPRNVDTLRKEARTRVEKARKSNETIIFGLGHSSVAEHAVFNFDIMDISRLAVESIEHFRLASYTEKSQRYIRLGRDFVVPQEISESEYRDGFMELIEYLSGAYEEVYRRIEGAGEDKYVAREDARYLMPLATSAQLGMTLNARAAEYMISRLASHPLQELREFAGKLSSIAGKVAPSLIKYPEPTEYFKSMPQIRKRFAGNAKRVDDDGKMATLVSSTASGDEKLAAGLIFSSSSISYFAALEKARSMKKSEIRDMICETLQLIKPHDSVWREFENIQMLFEVTVSASCYAQLKRHRMATQIVQPYDTSLGCTVPATVKKGRAVSVFRRAVDRSEKFYRKIASTDRILAEYVLTNAHRRRVLLNMNLRELYHFSRLRSDTHAQWEIRDLSGELCSIASSRYPAGTMMLSGKDGFDEAMGQLLNK